MSTCRAWCHGGRIHTRRRTAHARARVRRRSVRTTSRTCAMRPQALLRRRLHTAVRTAWHGRGLRAHVRLAISTKAAWPIHRIRLIRWMAHAQAGPRRRRRRHVRRCRAAGSRRTTWRRRQGGGCRGRRTAACRWSWRWRGRGLLRERRRDGRRCGRRSRRSYLALRRELGRCRDIVPSALVTLHRRGSWRGWRRCLHRLHRLRDHRRAPSQRRAHHRGRRRLHSCRRTVSALVVRWRRRRCAIRRRIR